MKKLLILLTSNFMLITFGYSQEIEWQKIIGGNNDDRLYSILQTPDGGYILGGGSASNISGDKTDDSQGGNDYWIMKTDESGNIQWQNTIGGSYSDFLSSIIETKDGGYMLGGYSSSNISGDKTQNCSGLLDYWIVKIDSNGIVEWDKTFGGNNYEYISSIVQTNDVGYLIGGWSISNISGDKTEDTIGGYDYWIVKTDSLGNIQWQNTIGGSYDDELFSVIQTTDGGFMLGGYSKSNVSGDKTENSQGGSDYWIVKTDSLGSIQWQNTIGGNSDELIKSIQQTMDGGYILGGSSYSDISGDKTENSSISDIWIIKTDSIGNLQWQNTIDGNSSDDLNSIQQTLDKGFILGGFTTSKMAGDKTEGCFGSGDYWVIKTDSLGNIQWQNTIGGSDFDQAFSVKQTQDGNYIVGGYSDSNISGDKSENSKGGDDFWIVRLTDRYNLISGKTFIDSNSNSVQDSGDFAITSKLIYEINTGRFSFSNKYGIYNVAVIDTGTFTVSPMPINYYNTVPVSHDATFNNMYQTDSLNDFAFQPIGAINDLCISITPLENFRSNRNASYMISYENVGTTTLSPTVIFFPYNNVTFVSANVTPTSITTDSVVWNFSALSPFQSGNILVTVHVNAGLPNGTLINSSAAIDPIIGDANTSCNYSAWEVYSTGSYDPNGIMVDEDTIISSQISNPPYLGYIIYFQNTGNDTAFNVKILNPIDTSRLDLSSIEFVASSHLVNLNWITWERNMEFIFDNILLPDSNVNEPASHGFVRYRIKPKSTLLEGDSILNNAYIYFDFNEPLPTNTATTEIVSPYLLTSLTNTVCDSMVSPSGLYVWTASGIYNDTVPSIPDFYTVYTVDLTVNQSTMSLITTADCNSYLSPSGKYIWLASGIYNDTIPNAIGCDSVITIDLTINSDTYSFVSTTSCNSYISPSGNILTTTGFYNDTISNANGCDSIITIDLTINNDSYSSLTIASCDSYTSPGGNIYATSGTYMDTIQNVNGCDSIITINLTINTVDTGVTVTGTTLSSNAPGANYQWMFCDSALITGANNQSYIATSSGSYSVIINQNGCVDTSNCNTLLNTTLFENHQQLKLNVFPDPAKNTITIECNQCQSFTGNIFISDMYGREVFSLNSIEHYNKDFSITIDVSHLASGVYLINLYSNHSVARVKFVKE